MKTNWYQNLDKNPNETNLTWRKGQSGDEILDEESLHLGSKLAIQLGLPQTAFSVNRLVVTMCESEVPN